MTAPHQRPWLACLAPAAWAIWLYWPIRHLPLIYDTLLHIRIANNLTLGSVWVPTEAFGFYRPLTFLPLILIRQLWGSYPPELLNALNVGQHALNTALLSALVWRCGGDRWRALAAGWLCAAFPFTYQAVAVYGHNVHPATANLLLIGLHLYVSLVRDRPAWARRGWLALSALFGLALLSHESAILFGVLAALVHSQLDPQLSVRRWRALTPALVFSLLGLLYVGLYQLLPITRAPQAVAEAAAPALKLLYLAQATAYPLTWWGHLLSGLPAAGLILGATAVTLFFSLWRARHTLRVWLWGWGWWAAAALLIALPLPAGYLLHGPRLLYVGSLGLAVTWATALVPQPDTGTPRRTLLAWLSPSLSLAALAGIILTGSLFVRARLADYTRLTDGLPEIETAMAGRAPTEGVLLINLPAWLGPARNTFPIGAELAAQLGYHLFAGEWVNDNLGSDRPVDAIQVDDLLAQPGYLFGLHVQTPTLPVKADWAPAGSALFVTRYLPDGPHLTWVGRLTPPETPSSAPRATFGPYTLQAASAYQCGDQATLILTWRLSAGEAPASASIFAQWLDESGRLAAQQDGPPLSLRPDLLTLPPGWQMVDVRRLAAAPIGGHILLGAYDYISGQRFPAMASDGRPLPDDALTLPLTPCPIAAP